MVIFDKNNIEVQCIGLVDNSLRVKTIKLAHDEHIVGVKGKYSCSNKYNSVFQNF